VADSKKESKQYKKGADQNSVVTGKAAMKNKLNHHSKRQESVPKPAVGKSKSPVSPKQTQNKEVDNP